MNLKEFLDSNNGKEFKEFLLNECKNVNNIKNVRLHSSAAAQALEFKAQLKAGEILNSILSKIMTLDSPIVKKDKRDNYF